jgi:hypothetical protein
MRQPNGTEFYITEERIQHIPGYSGAAYVQIILVDENGNDAGGVSFECDYKKKRLTGKTKWFEPKLSRRYRVTADHIEHILSRWLKENSIVDRAVPDMPPPAGAKVFFGAGNSLFVRIFNSGDWWEGISLAMRRKLFPDEGVLSLPTPSVDVDILQGAILQDVTPPCAILPGTTLREATSSAATTAQPETTAASPSDTAPRATPAETLRNFVVNGRVESKKVSKEKAAHLAAQFDKVCGEHSLMPASPVLSLPRVIRWDADLNDVNSYSAFGLNLIYFKDVFNPTVGYFMLTDGKGMIGYGVSEGVGTEARFRFQVFPEFRKGPGVFVLRLISWKLYREFPRSTRFVFLRLELMSDKDMVKAALESGLPKFLMKNGFVAEGDTSDLTKCDFAFYIDSRKEDKAARGQPGRTEVIATIQTNELGRGRVAPRRTSPIFAQGFKVYLSENLFRPEDISALKSVLREEVVEIAAPAAIMVKATNPTRATKIGCIVTKEDFDTYWQPSARANSNKATMLAVDISDAGEAKDRDLANIYLENMVRLVAAMADDPQDAARETKIRYYVSVLFLGDKSSADALEKYLKDNDSAAFAALAALRFKPMRRMDPKTIETYKINVNKLLESA